MRKVELSNVMRKVELIENKTFKQRAKSVQISLKYLNWADLNLVRNKNLLEYTIRTNNFELHSKQCTK